MGFGDFFRHITLVFASYLGLLGIPLPMPVPPQPEDPVLICTAPADSLLFVQWFGHGQPLAETKNRTENLAREPEVRAMVARLLASSRNALEREGRGAQEFEPVLTLFDQAATMFEHPGCLTVQSLAPFSGSLVVKSGSDALEKAIHNVLSSRARGNVEFDEKDVAGVTFAGLALPGDAESLLWTTTDGYFVMAVGEAAAKQVVAGLQGKDQGLAAAPGMRKMRAACKVERPMLRTYASMAKMAEQAPFTVRFYEPLGLTHATAALAESGLEGDGFVSRLHLLVAKNKQADAGVLGLLRGKPLSLDDLALVPGDATTALAFRTASGTVERAAMLACSSLAGKDPTPYWERFVAQGKQQVDVDISKDLVAHVDDCAVVWNSPGQGGLGFTGAVGALPLRDGKAFGDNLAKMWDALMDVAPTKKKAREKGERIRPYRGYLGSFEHAGSKVWWMDHIDRDLPFGISWASTARHALISMQPQQMKTAIEHSDRPDFDKALVRKPAVARRGSATAMLYVDLKGLLQQCYGGLLVIFQAESHEWQSEGFDFELADVPRLESLTKHLGAEMTVLEPVDDGWMITRRGTLPVFDTLLVSVGTACALLLD